MGVRRARSRSITSKHIHEQVDPDNFIGSHEKMPNSPRSGHRRGSISSLRDPARWEHAALRPLRRDESASDNIPSQLMPIHETAKQRALACTGSMVHEQSSLILKYAMTGMWHSINNFAPM